MQFPWQESMKIAWHISRKKSTHFGLTRIRNNP